MKYSFILLTVALIERVVPSYAAMDGFGVFEVFPQKVLKFYGRSGIISFPLSVIGK